MLPVHGLVDAHQTAAYAFGQFEHPNVQIVSSVSSQGIDLDQDGLYDQLRVTVPVTVQTTGDYNWSASLFDQLGREIGFAGGAGRIEANPITHVPSITLDFSGAPINGIGVDGPYLVGNAVVFGAGGTGIAAEVGWTEAYSAMQFEGPCGTGGPCDVPHDTPGCADPACCAAVCAIDPYCCEVEWDELCALAAANCAPPCLADFNGNNSVMFEDLVQMLSVWGPCSTPCPEDLNGNGEVEFADLTLLLNAWGPCGF